MLRSCPGRRRSLSIVLVTGFALRNCCLYHFSLADFSTDAIALRSRTCCQVLRVWSADHARLMTVFDPRFTLSTWRSVFFGSWFLRRPIVIPACSRCRRRARHRTWIEDATFHAMFGIVICTGFHFRDVFAVWPMGLCAMIILSLGPLMVWALLKPKPFSIHSGEGGIEYRFRQHEFMKEFYQLNTCGMLKWGPRPRYAPTREILRESSNPVVCRHNVRRA